MEVGHETGAAASGDPNVLAKITQYVSSGPRICWFNMTQTLMP
jgi:hypothetical protein